MSSTQLGGCVDLSEGGGAAGPRFSHVEVPEPHPPSCDVAVGGVHGTVDVPSLHSGALQPVVTGWSRRVALVDLPAGHGWFVGRQSQRARAEEKFLLDPTQCFYQAIGQVLQTLLQAVPEVGVAAGNVAQLRAGTRTRWPLRARHSIPSRETRNDRTSAVGVC